jgi:hypothetical protein
MPISAPSSPKPVPSSEVFVPTLDVPEVPAISAPEALETPVSVSAPEEYSVTKADEAPVYVPTDKTTTLLKGMAICQEQRMILNVGGKSFQTCAPTLSSEPDSWLSVLATGKSPMKPYQTGGLDTYFIDRNPRFFDFILDFLRDPAQFSRILPADRNVLRQLHVEANFYKLSGLVDLIERKNRELCQKSSLWEV